MRPIAFLVVLAAALPAKAHPPGGAPGPVFVQPWTGAPPPTWLQPGLPPWAVPTPPPPPFIAQPIPPNPVFQNDPSLRDRDLLQEELEVRRRLQRRWEEGPRHPHEQGHEPSWRNGNQQW